MSESEIADRILCGDPRIFNAIQEAKLYDKSFTEKENIFTMFKGGISYPQAECRKFWFQAMAIGIKKGLEMASPEGQRIDLSKNCKNEHQQEFLEKFYKLAEEYNCSISYHPIEGMTIRDLK